MSSDGVSVGDHSDAPSAKRRRLSGSSNGTETPHHHRPSSSPNLKAQMKFLSSERQSLKLSAKKQANPFEYFSASSNASTEMRKGDDHLHNRNYIFAIDSYRKAISMDQDNKHVYFRLGRAHLENSEPDKAIPFLKKALSIDRTESNSLSSAGSLYLYLGGCYMAMKRFEEAVKCYQHALLRNPFCIFSRVGLGRAMKYLNQIEPAIQHFRLAVHIEPTDATALECLAFAEFDANDYESCRKHLEMLLAIVPNHPQAGKYLLWLQSNQMPPPQFKSGSSASTTEIDTQGKNAVRNSSNEIPSSSGNRSWFAGTPTEKAFSALMESWNDAVQTLGQTVKNPLDDVI